MAKFLVSGGKPLKGIVDVSGNKNSVLKLIPATLIADSVTTLTNVPHITDVLVMIDLIKSLGASAVLEGDKLTIDPQGLHSYDLDPTLCSRIRASVVLAAPLLVKFGKAVITPPGGDSIGDRFLDTHFSMMKKMGVLITRKDGRFFLEWEKKDDTNIFLEEASVTATEMGLIMASGINNQILIENAACEPHIVDLGNMLTKMGADIKGLGTNTLLIKGGKTKGTEHRVMPDHIEAGTFVIASAITKGNLIINDFILKDNRMALLAFDNMGIKYKLGENKIEVLPSDLVAARKKFKAQPWPGFPTDLMSPFIVLATQTQGTVLCHDFMYEWRMFFVDDLIGMGANIFIADPHRVIISGPTKLMADRLFCKDIRAGMSVILAALVAEGESVIENVEVVDRGYQNIEERLKKLGASIVKQ